MYYLSIFEPNRKSPLETVTVTNAAEVLTTIPTLFAQHPGCERVEVRLDTTHLFSIDCAGNRIG